MSYKPRTQYQGMAYSNTYVFPISSTSTSTSSTLTSGTLRLSPFYNPQTLSITRIGLEVNTAGDSTSVVRLGIYNDNNCKPSSLVLDAGTVAANVAGIPEVILGSTLSLPPGWYWIGGAVQGVTTTQPNIVTVSVIPTTGLLFGSAGSTIPGAATILQGWAQASVTGALPTTFTGGLGTSGSPRLFFKLA